VAASADAAFAFVGDPKRNVRVVVIDLDQYPVNLVHNLRILFPSSSVRIVVLTKDPTKRARARDVGANVYLSRRTAGAKLGSIITALSLP
jgi:hypothetical protein